MLDYNASIIARAEHEERMRVLERKLSMRKDEQRNGMLNRLLYGMGESLERFGAYLKAQHATRPFQRQYQSSRPA
jgi:hypothetical protein